MYFIKQLKNTILRWEIEILKKDMISQNYSEQFCYEETEIIIEKLKKIKNINDIIKYFMESYSYEDSIKMVLSIMMDTPSLVN